MVRISGNYIQQWSDVGRNWMNVALNTPDNRANYGIPEGGGTPGGPSYTTVPTATPLQLQAAQDLASGKISGDWYSHYYLPLSQQEQAYALQQMKNAYGPMGYNTAGYKMANLSLANRYLIARAAALAQAQLDASKSVLGANLMQPVVYWPNTGGGIVNPGRGGGGGGSVVPTPYKGIGTGIGGWRGSGKGDEGIDFGLKGGGIGSGGETPNAGVGGNTSDYPTDFSNWGPSDNTSDYPYDFSNWGPSDNSSTSDYPTDFSNWSFEDSYYEE